MELSPNAMARAAYEDAVAQIKIGPSGGRDGGRSHGEESGVDKSGHAFGESADSEHHGAMFFDTTLANNSGNSQNDKAMVTRIEDIWRSCSGTVETKISETMETILSEIDSLVGLGIDAFSQLDTTTRQLHHSKELAENRAREAKRLLAIDEQSRSTLSVSVHTKNISFPFPFPLKMIMILMPILFYFFS